MSSDIRQDSPARAHRRTGGATVGAGVVQTLSGQWARFLIQAVSVVVLARLVSPAEFGLFAMVAALAALALVLADSGLSYAAVQAPTLTEAQHSNLFWIGTAAGVVVAGSAAALAPTLASFYGEPRVTLVVVALTPIFVLAALAAQFRARLTRDLRFTQLAAADVTGQASGLAVALGIALVQPSVWALVAQQVIAGSVTLLWVAIAARWRPRWPSTSGDLRPLLRFAAGVAGEQVVGHVSMRADTVALGRVSDVADVGVYARMHQLFSIPLQQLAAPLTRVALPHLSRVDDDRWAALLVSVQRAMAYAFVVAYACVVVTADPLVRVTLGNAWSDGATVLAVLAVGGVFHGIGYVCYWVLLARARTGIALRIAVATRLVMIIAVFCVAPSGPLAVAGVVAAATALHWLVLSLVGMPCAGVPTTLLLRPVLRPAAVGLALVGVGVPFGQLLPMDNAWIELTARGMVCTVVVAGCLAASRSMRGDLHDYVTRVRRMRRGEPEEPASAPMG